MIIQLVIVTIILFTILALISLCVAYLFYRWEWKVLLIFVPLIILQIIKPINANNIFFFSIFFITGILSWFTVKKEKSITLYVVASSVLITILLLGGHYFLNNEPVLRNYTKKEFAEMLNKYQVPADFKKEILKDYKQNKELFRAMPFLMFLSVLLFSGIAFVLNKRMFERILQKKLTGLELFKLNDFIIFLLIGGWATFILVLNRSSYVIETWALNIALVVTTFYFIQALGIIKFAMIKKGMPTVILPFFIIFMLSNITVGTIVSVLLTGIGALDVWADFRKLNSNNNL